MIYAYGIEENCFIWHLLTIHSAIPFLFCELKARLEKGDADFFWKKVENFYILSSNFLDS